MRLLESVKAGHACYGDDCGEYHAEFLGTATTLDPCGRYHHILSPNGVTDRCAEFWESLQAEAEDIGAWIESAEGDPLDQFLCWSRETAPNWETVGTDHA